jgi:hypothetical protein
MGHLTGGIEARRLIGSTPGDSVQAARPGYPRVSCASPKGPQFPHWGGPCPSLRLMGTRNALRELSARGLALAWKDDPSPAERTRSRSAPGHDREVDEANGRPDRYLGRAPKHREGDSSALRACVSSSDLLRGRGMRAVNRCERHCSTAASLVSLHDSHHGLNKPPPPK